MEITAQPPNHAPNPGAERTLQGSHVLLRSEAVRASHPRTLAFTPRGTASKPLARLVTVAQWEHYVPSMTNKMPFLPS